MTQDAVKGGAVRSGAIRSGIVLFGLLVLVAAYETAIHPTISPEVARAQAAVSWHLAQQAAESLGTGRGWTAVTIDEAEPNRYALTLHYAARPNAPGQAEADAKSVVGAMLCQLALAGRHPSDERTAIAVQAQLDAADPPAPLASATYDPATDQIR